MQTQVPNTNLVKLCLIAVFIAAICLVTIILPAEYNIDPTGVGEKLGLTVLSNTEVQQSTIAKLDESKVSTKEKQDDFEIIVPANRGVEFKFSMGQFAKMSYEWQTDGQPLYFDLHGEPEGDTTGYFESYAIATLTKMEGSYTTPFAGSHGWYWRNKTAKDIKVTLKVNGEYHIIGLKK